jgi:hypothetical protein
MKREWEMDKKERERLYSKEREILEMLCDLQKEDIRFAGFTLYEVIGKWALIWNVLDDLFMDDREAVMLSWLEQYVEGKMRGDELLKRVKEMRAELNREWEDLERKIKMREMIDRVRGFFLKPIRFIGRLFRRRKLPF